MKRIFWIQRLMAAAWVALSFNGGVAVAAGNSEAQLIPRTALFGNPVRAQARLSPDGRYMSFLAPKNGVLNVWLPPFGQVDCPPPMTHHNKRCIPQHPWAG